MRTEVSSFDKWDETLDQIAKRVTKNPQQFGNKAEVLRKFLEEEREYCEKLNCCLKVSFYLILLLFTLILFIFNVFFICLDFLEAIANSRSTNIEKKEFTKNLSQPGSDCGTNSDVGECNLSKSF